MPTSSLGKWEREFRRAAKADNLALFRDHLRRLDLPDEPELLLHGTILIVQACCAYAALDRQPTDGFLAMQRYDPADAGDAKYAFTFDLFGRAFGRVLTAAKAGALDLADLYEHPWSEYEISGYRWFWVSRTDGHDLVPDEVEQIQARVTEDLRFDYTDDELAFWFDDSAVEGALLVTLQPQDVDDLKDVDEDEEVRGPNRDRED